MAQNAELEALIAATGMTKGEFAKAAQISRDGLNKYLAGKRKRPQVREVGGMADAAGVPYETMRVAIVDGCNSSASSSSPQDPSSVALSALWEIAVDRTPGLHVRPIRNLDELKVLWGIDNRAYGNANVTFESFQSWWLAYPHGLQAILQDQDVLGAVGIWPVPESWQRDFWAGRCSEEELSAEMVAEAAHGPRTNWYISGVVLDASKQRTGAIASLLRQAALAWGHEANIREPVTVTAMAISQHGERLLNRFSFSLVSHGAKDGYPIYTRTVAPRDLALMLA